MDTEGSALASKLITMSSLVCIRTINKRFLEANKNNAHNKIANNIALQYGDTAVVLIPAHFRGNCKH